MHTKLIIAMGLWAALSGTALAGSGLPVVDVFKSATCGCCARWSEHMRANGFEVRTHDVPDVAAERRRLGIADGISGCHTAVVNGYVIEGHVPASDVKRLLGEKPKALGLAVPNMPGGAPGMENQASMSYEVLLVNANGSVRGFTHH